MVVKQLKITNEFLIFMFELFSSNKLRNREWLWGKTPNSYKLEQMPPVW